MTEKMQADGTIDEIARILGFKAAKIRRLVDEHKITATRANRWPVAPIVAALLSDARRDRDRARAAREEIERQIAEAERREAGEALARRRADAEARAARVAKRLSVEYVRAARTIVDLLHELHAVEAEVADLNSALAHAGRGHEVIAGPEARALPASRTGVVIGLLRATSLPPCGSFEGVGPARVEAERHGIAVG
jgi:hypothetical protein